MNKKLEYFTLIELLVVIAIIAILTSMLQPVLYKSKERAKYIRWVVYTSNLRSDPSLIGQWNFEDTESDKILNSAQGITFEGYTPKTLNGELGGICKKSKKGRWLGKGAIYLTGTASSSILIKDNGILNPQDDDFTIFLWFKPTTKNQGCILSKWHGSGRGILDFSFLYLNSKTMTVKVKISDGKNKVNRFPLKNFFNQWHFAAIVVSRIDTKRGKVTAYFDGYEGAAVKSQEFNIPAKVNSRGEEYLSIGVRKEKAVPFRGYIDEIEIFKRALSVSEIKNAYEMGRPQ